MGKNLVVVESPAKAKTIHRFLGKDFTVKASMGHIRDLPERRLGVDVDAGFRPRYEVVKGREKVVKELCDAAAKSDAVYLAPDPDREGEAIAWHLEALLAPEAKTAAFHRVRYNEITPQAVRAAFRHPTAIDARLVDAQQARRVLDRLVGYRVSPLLWGRIQRGLSAGRVQSVALRLLCEREQEIQAFVPEEYWVLGARVRKRETPLDPFTVKLVQIGGEKAAVGDGEQARALLASLEGRDLRVGDVRERELHKRSRPPHITSSLQQAASTRYRMSPENTMRVAQRLYEGVDFGEGEVGLITYMRTDSYAVSNEAANTCRDFIRDRYGDPYVPERPPVYANRAGAQAAHEAIRPTDVTRTPEQLKGRIEEAEWKVYRLIWERFVASQAAPARIRQRTVDVVAPAKGEAEKECVFRAGASEILFPGHLRITGEDETPPTKARGKDEDEDGAQAEGLPPLAIGEGLDCLEWLSERKETQPPPRYSEAALVRVLEENGVGRPSTYAQVLATLKARKYVRREKTSLSPTPLGQEVNTLLVQNLPELFDVGFTAAMEAKLDEIEQGSVEWTRMLADFYEKFQGWLARAKGPEADRTAAGTLLAALEGVQEWAPPTPRARGTFSEEKFVASLRKQFEEGKRPLTERQLLALCRVASHYTEQVEGLAKVIEETGVEPPADEQPRETTHKKLETLRTVWRGRADIPDRDRDFIASLEQRVHHGRRLTPAQIEVLDRVLLRYSSDVEGFDGMREELGVTGPAPEDASVAAGLLALVAHVKEWKPPIKRGRREFNDESFAASLTDSFAKRGNLTPRQLWALKNLVRRYRAQIPGYDEAADTYGLKAKEGARRGRRANADAQDDADGDSDGASSGDAGT